MAGASLLAVISAAKVYGKNETQKNGPHLRRETQYLRRKAVKYAQKSAEKSRCYLLLESWNVRSLKDKPKCSFRSRYKKAEERFRVLR